MYFREKLDGMKQWFYKCSLLDFWLFLFCFGGIFLFLLFSFFGGEGGCLSLWLGLTL